MARRQSRNTRRIWHGGMRHCELKRWPACGAKQSPADSVGNVKDSAPFRRCALKYVFHWEGIAWPKPCVGMASSSVSDCVVNDSLQ